MMKRSMMDQGTVYNKKQKHSNKKMIQVEYKETSSKFIKWRQGQLHIHFNTTQFEKYIDRLFYISNIVTGIELKYGHTQMNLINNIRKIIENIPTISSDETHVFVIDPHDLTMNEFIILVYSAAADILELSDSSIDRLLNPIDIIKKKKTIKHVKKSLFPPKYVDYSIGIHKSYGKYLFDIGGNTKIKDNIFLDERNEILLSTSKIVRLAVTLMIHEPILQMQICDIVKIETINIKNIDLMNIIKNIIPALKYNIIYQPTQSTIRSKVHYIENNTTYTAIVLTKTKQTRRKKIHKRLFMKYTNNGIEIVAGQDVIKRLNYDDYITDFITDCFQDGVTLFNDRNNHVKIQKVTVNKLKYAMGKMYNTTINKMYQHFIKTNQRLYKEDILNGRFYSIQCVKEWFSRYDDPRYADCKKQFISIINQLFNTFAYSQTNIEKNKQIKEIYANGIPLYTSSYNRKFTSMNNLITPTDSSPIRVFGSLILIKHDNCYIRYDLSKISYLEFFHDLETYKYTIQDIISPMFYLTTQTHWEHIYPQVYEIKKRVANEKITLKDIIEYTLNVENTDVGEIVKSFVYSILSYDESYQLHNIKCGDTWTLPSGESIPVISKTAAKITTCNTTKKMKDCEMRFENNFLLVTIEKESLTQHKVMEHILKKYYTKEINLKNFKYNLRTITFGQIMAIGIRFNTLVGCFTEFTHTKHLMLQLKNLQTIEFYRHHTYQNDIMQKVVYDTISKPDKSADHVCQIHLQPPILSERFIEELIMTNHLMINLDTFNENATSYHKIQAYLRPKVVEKLTYKLNELNRVLYQGYSRLIQEIIFKRCN